MIFALYNYGLGLLLFALAGDVTSGWLRWLAVIVAGWSVVVGSVAGWQAARDSA